jgi:DNA polymerase I-like protein with 3'-5' exonuclease and polymerase domains
MKPSDLLNLAEHGVLPSGPVSLDTETSGLHVDDGARVAVVSIAFEMDEIWEDALTSHENPNGGHNNPTWGSEPYYDSLKVPLVSFAWPFDQGTSGTGKLEDTGQQAFFEDNVNLDRGEWEALLKWLEVVGEQNHRYLIMHNAKFDMHMMYAGVRRWPGLGVDLSLYLLWDTQNVCHLAWPESKTTSLKPTSKRLWGISETDESETVRTYLRQAKLPNGRWDLVPWEIIAPYAQQDARLTYRLYKHQTHLLGLSKLADWFEEDQPMHLTPTEAIDRRLAVTLMLYRIERRGLPFNGPKAAEIGKKIDILTADLETKLPFKPATLPMAKHYWFGTGDRGGVFGLGLKPYAFTQSGLPQVNATVVDKMVADKVKAAKEWRDLQKLQTVGSRWYHGWSSMAGPDGRLRASFRQNGTVSGRFSVERVQLQAIPHDYRLNGEIMKGIPTPRQLIIEGVPAGFELWELDLAQAELRVAALYADCTRMLGLIRNGDDLHGDAATQLFGVTPDDPKWGEMRNVAKRANFSLIFGIGADKLRGDIEAQTGIVLSRDETRKLVNDWHNLYPEYHRTTEQYMQIVEKRQRHHGLGWISLWNGERRWFTNEEETHKAFNQRVQPALAQFGLDWWLAADRRLSMLGPGNEIVMTVHDSLVLLLRSETAVDVASEVQMLGVEMWDQVFPGVPGGVDCKRWS